MQNSSNMGPAAGPQWRERAPGLQWESEAPGPQRGGGGRDSNGGVRRDRPPLWIRHWIQQMMSAASWNLFAHMYNTVGSLTVMYVYYNIRIKTSSIIVVFKFSQILLTLPWIPVAGLGLYI